ncbi:MAG TPA: hypothetical protein VGC18_14615 [Lacisediminihabitans sp.]|uniref:hypothetical protein n=1 Tax=Lacisediminihabitans sp. TaxID=2787631 RepID=UPI002ED7AD46
MATGNNELSKPIAGAVFVLGWAIAITLWSLTHLAPDFATRGFIADVGILCAAVGFAAPFLATRSGLVASLVLGLIGVALFAFSGYLHITVIVYLLRILAPLLALLTPLYKLTSFRIFA